MSIELIKCCFLATILSSTQVTPTESSEEKNSWGQLAADYVTLYEDPQGAVVRLSKERETPFLKIGKSPRLTNSFKRYRSAIKRFPSIRDCLLASEQQKKIPNLGAIDWEKIDTEQEAAVCAFRAASSYGTPDAFEIWLRAQGLSVGGRTISTWKNPPTTTVTGTLSTRKKGVLYSKNWLQGWWTGKLAYGFGLSVTYESDGRVSSAHAGYSIL